MSEQALIRRDDSALSCDFTAAALALKNNALESGALIGRVNSADTQDAAVLAQREIANVLSLAEKARKACKEPVLEFGKRIDDAARTFSAELKAEQMRIAKLVADFQALEQARVRAAQQAENERLLELEREKARALQEAKTHEQMERIQAIYNQRAADEAPPAPIAPVRAAGQTIREEWEISVTDIWLLAKAHPTCVKIEPVLTEIKGLLNAGVKVSGISAKKEIRASVRAGRVAVAIEV